MTARLPLAILVLLLGFAPVLQGQTKIEEQKRTNRQIKCVITVADNDWRSNKPAFVVAKVQNTTAHVLRLDVEPVLYLISKTSPAERDRYWAPVDIIHDAPLPTNRVAIGTGGQAEAISSRSIRLEFKPRETLEFKVNARNPLWAREISSVWPSEELFSVVEPGEYSLKLVFQTSRGTCESEPVDDGIGSDQPKK